MDERALPYSYTFATGLESINVITLSLVTFWLSYTLFNSYFTTRLTAKMKAGEIVKTVADESLLGKVLHLSVVISGILYTLFNIEAIIFVLQHGYVTYYAYFKSRLPELIVSMASRFEMFFWIAMFALKENSRKKRFALSLYFFNLLLILILGKRGPLILGIMMIVLYRFKTVLPHRENLLLFRRFILIMLILGAIILPVVMSGLYMYGVFRTKRELNVSINNLLDGAKMFLTTQGLSGLQHINYVVSFSDRLERHSSYLLAPVLHAIRSSPVSRMLGLYKELIPHTYEFAVESGYWSHMFSYLMLGEGYLHGAGTGSCYIAEAYLDMKIIGVIMINILYALFINYAIYGPVKNPILMGFIFYPVSAVLYAPRSVALEFAGRMTNSYNLMFLCIFLVLHSFNRRRLLEKDRF